METFLKASLLSLFLLSSSYGLTVADPLNVKEVRRLVEKGELLIANPVNGEISVFTYSGGELRLHSFFRAGFRPGMKLLAGDLMRSGREQVLLLRSREAGGERMSRGNLEIYRFDGRRFTLASTYAYGISENDSFAVACFSPDRYACFLIRGNSSRNRIEVISLEGYVVSTYRTDVERYDRLASGDFDGDGVDEVAFADADRNEVQLFRYDLKGRRLLKEGSIRNASAGIYDREDLISFGDVDGDGKEELLFLKSRRGVLYAFDERGRIESSFTGRLMKGATSMVSFDADGDGFCEVFIGSPETGALLIVRQVLRTDGSFFWKARRVREIKFLKGEVLAGGDLRGLSLFVGKPLPPERVELALVPLVVVNDPPKERALFGAPHQALGRFFAAYRSLKESGQELEVEQSVGVSFSVEKSYSKRSPFSLYLKKIKGAVRNRVEMSRETSGYRRVVERLEQRLVADGYQDRGVYLSGSYYAFYYPVVAPRELAFRNGERQFLMVTVPDTSVMRVGVPYSSSVHVTGYVASYPRDRFGLYNYEPQNELARGEMVIGCGETEIGYTRSVERGSSSSQADSGEKFTAEEGRIKIPLVGKVSKFLPADPSSGSRKRERSSYEFSFTAYTLYLKKVDAFTVRSTGNWSWCAEPDKSYTVGVVIYADSEDGHLILDYYVPQRGSYYKEPPFRPAVTPFFLDTRSGKKLYLAPLRFKARFTPVF